MSATSPRTAWGKLTRLPDGGVAIHPLLDHLVDVASVLQALLETPGLRRAAERAAGRRLDDVDVARLCVIAYLHDIGKACTGFQIRYWLADARHASPPAGWLAPRCGHGPQGWALFGSEMGAVERRRLLDAPLIDALDQWGPGSSLALMHASISHHGRPVLGDPSPAFWQPVVHGGITLYDPAKTIAAMGRAVRELYPLSFDGDAAPLPDSPAFTHLFAGLVQLADWLGSDTRPGFFPYTALGEDRQATALERARHAVKAIGLHPGDARSRQQATHGDFTRAFGLPTPRPMQQAMSDAGLGPLVVLEAETGSGKTEAALWRFLHLWRGGQVDALYFALPTRVAATQLCTRVEDFVTQTWGSRAPVVVRALPGYTSADGQGYEPLPHFQVLWHDHPSDAEAERRWAAESPKRFLAATIAVGTVDQALLGALQIKHAHLRHATLARSLLVIDEVHASDAYMTRLTEHLLGAHLACGGQAMLLSATLGAVARHRYLGLGASRRSGPPTLAEARALPYPALSDRGPSGPRMRPVEGNPRAKAVHWAVLDIIDEPLRIAALAVDGAARGARVLVVRNTVGAAIATLRAVEGLAEARDVDCLFRVGGVSTLHHSRFSPQDRPLLDAEVQAQIGKRRSDPRGRVIVGTQTLEQSLDIDADLLITDLCPMDVLLQRLGRLHRHERPSAEAPADHRPAGFDVPRAWVLTPPGHDLSPLLRRQRHGLGAIRSGSKPIGGVYVDLRVLEATRRLIAAAPLRSIPAENRMLVECSTHPEALDEIARELGDDWKRFGNDVDGSSDAKAMFASVQALPFQQLFGDQLFPEDEGSIGSRLGAADRLVVFDEPCPIGPFGQRVERLAIRHHMLPVGLAMGEQPTDVCVRPGDLGFTFRLGSGKYRYGRLGLERASSPMDGVTPPSPLTRGNSSAVHATP